VLVKALNSLGLIVNTMSTDTQIELELLIREIVKFRTDPDGVEHRAAAAWLSAALKTRGFSVAHHGSDDAPLIIAQRPPLASGQGQLVLYGHYDVDEIVPGWMGDPFELAEVSGRWVGLGVGDNKGAIASRLLSLSAATTTPAITWIIQAEEETGSATLRQWLSRCGMPTANWYLDENGWAEQDGTPRLLLCERTAEGWKPLEDKHASRWSSCFPNPPGVSTAARVLNKIYVPGGCPFQAALPVGATYLAFGLNDTSTKIHRPNESISIQCAVKHVHDFVSMLHHMANGA
jgi:cysteinylglycine-S-conjugate dipeptidase